MITQMISHISQRISHLILSDLSNLYDLYYLSEASLCPSLPNYHHAYQLSDLLSQLLSLSACFWTASLAWHNNAIH